MDLDDELETFQRQALEIRAPDENFDPSVVPQNGEEYLTHMLYERKRCPVIVVRRPDSQLIQNASIVTTSLPVDEKPPPKTLLPNAEWKIIQVEDFLAHREKISEMRKLLSNCNYNQSLELPLVTGVAKWYEFCQNHSPVLSIVLRIDQRTLEQLLVFISDWLNGETEDSDMDTVCDASSSSSKSNTVPLDLTNGDQWLGSWLYAVLACLQLPLEPDVHSTLRDVARSCIRWRGKLLHDETEKAKPYNLFIHLIAKVFDQLDFAIYV